MTKNAKKAIIRVRIDEHIKNQAEIILKDLGLTPQLAIELLYRQIITQRKIPFEIRLHEIPLLPALPMIEKYKVPIIYKGKDNEIL